MKTPASSIVMFLVAALLGAVGQYLYKVGSLGSAAQCAADAAKTGGATRA
jgi:hypothetical protein